MFTFILLKEPCLIPYFCERFENGGILLVAYLLKLMFLCLF